METLTANSPKILAFLAAWHENGRASFNRMTPGLDYDDYKAKTAKERRKYIALDYGNQHNRSGCFLVERETGIVYSIKAYGVPNRVLGSLAEMTAKFVAASATQRLYRPNAGVDIG